MHLFDDLADRQHRRQKLHSNWNSTLDDADSPGAFLGVEGIKWPVGVDGRHAHGPARD